MKKYRLIIMTILLTMLSIFTYAQAKTVEVATEIDKRDLVVELNKTKDLMSSIIKDKNIIKFAGVKYLESEEFDQISEKINEAEKILKDEKASKAQINKLRKELFSEINPNLAQIAPYENDEPSKPSEYFAKLYDLEIYNYKQDYKDFYDNYYQEKIEDLKKSTVFREEYLETLKEMQTLFDFIKSDSQNKAVPRQEYRFLKRKSPFNAMRPTLSNLPKNNETLLLTKGINENLFAKFNITAKDAFGEDISANIGFKQDVNYSRTGKTFVQIKVEDRFNNEFISTEIYQLVIKNKDSENIAPVISVSEPKEIMAYSKLKNTDIRSFARAKDQYGVLLEKDNIKYDITYASGVSANHLFENGKLKEDAFEPYGVFNIKYWAIDNENLYSNKVSKELIVLPRSPKFNSSTSTTSSNLSLNELSLNISDLKNIKNFLSDDLIKYYYKASVPLKERAYADLGYNNNASKRDVILYDQVKQFKNLVNKLSGYHMQNYHQLFNYIKAIVVNNNQGAISIPSRDIINLFHKNGVKVYGSINIPSAAYGGQASDILALCKDENINILNELAKELGFDGWHIAIKRGLYNYSDEFNKLPILKQQEELENKEKSKAIVKNQVLPFLNNLKNKLNENQKELLLESALNTDGNDKGSRAYNTLLKDFAQNCDYFITSYDANSSGKIDIQEELTNYQNETAKDQNTLYKGVYAGYNLKNVDNLNNYVDYLVNDKLHTNLFLTNVCERIFSLKNDKADYTEDNPEDITNLYQSNNYYAYEKRLTMFTTRFNIFNTATNEMLTKYNSLTNNEDKQNFDKSVYFNLAEFIIPRFTLGTIATNFNLANTQKFIAKNETNYKDYKDFFGNSGFNQLAMQDILPTWLNHTDNETNLKYSMLGAYQGSNNLNYYNISNNIGDNHYAYLYALNTKANGQVYKLKYQVKNTDNLDLGLFYTTKDNVRHIIGTKTTTSSNPEIIEFTLPNTGEDITSIGITIKNNSSKIINLNLIALYFGAITSTSQKELSSFLLDKIGFNKYLNAEALISYEKLTGINRYYVYQVVNDKEYLLGVSYESTQFIKNIIRYKNGATYDSEFKLKVVAVNEIGEIVATKELTKSWENDVEDISLAKVKLDKKIAKVGEAITMELISDENFQNYELDLMNKPGEAQHNLVSAKVIKGTNKISLVFYKEGFYSFRYKVISKSGKTDIIEVKYGITISNSTESEVDLTGDASIKDDFADEDITYSKGIPNNAERPRFLIDKDTDGKPNLATKWCCTAKGPNQRWVILEFGDVVSITRFMLSHGATSTSNSFDKNMKGINTVEYEIYTSMDGVNWTKVVHHKNNTDNVTIDKLEEAVEAKYVKLNVINGGFDISARIYDMRIYGSR